MLYACLSDQGRERPRNEDNLFVRAEGELALFVVADGMGGHRAGNVASEMAVNAAARTWDSIDKSVLPDLKTSRKLLEDLITEANLSIFDEASARNSRQGMGTTLTAALVCGNRVTIGHVGDSRAYNIYNGTMTLLTKDHSLLEQLIEAGQVQPDQAENHPQRHVLTRAIGISPDLVADIVELELEKGSSLILCTDGLTNMVRDEEILAIHQQYGAPEEMVKALVDLANSRGGHDNITVVVVSDIGGPQL